MSKLNEMPYFDREGNEANFNKHYDSHVLGIGDHADNDRYLLKGITRDEYNELANEISESPAGSIHSGDDIVGYIANNGKYIKYRESDKLMVVYIKDKPGDKDQAISLYKVKPMKFMNMAFSDGKFGFAKELPENEKIAEALNKIDNYEKLTVEDLEGLDLNYIIESLRYANNTYWSMMGFDDNNTLESIKLVENLLKD